MAIQNANLVFGVMNKLILHNKQKDRQETELKIIVPYKMYRQTYKTHDNH